MAHIAPKKAIRRLEARQAHYDRLVAKMPDKLRGDKRPGSNKAN
jgi:hypothetical protein